MATFTDRLGEEWAIAPLTVGFCQRVRKAGGADLFRLQSEPGDFASVMFADPEKLGRTLFLLCDPESRQVDADAFADRFDGPTLERAGEALAEAVCDFFPRSKVAQALRSRVRATFEQADAAMVRAMTSTPSGSPTSSPGSAASTPPR